MHAPAQWTIRTDEQNAKVACLYAFSGGIRTRAAQLGLLANKPRFPQVHIRQYISVVDNKSDTVAHQPNTL